MDGFREWEGESPHWYSFAWKDGMTFPEMLKILDNEAKGVGLAPGRVPHTMLYGFLDGAIIGRVSVRHELNEKLRERGGHIGYSVAKRYRRRGYATEMVKQAMEFCRQLGLSSIMVTCSDGNEPSWRIIEKFGGNLEDRIFDQEDQELIRRYWIPL